MKLLQTAEWEDSEVALLYSMPSAQIGWMMDSEADGKSWNQRSDSYEPDHISMFFDHVAWNKLLEDVGVKGRWMSYLELVNNTLATVRAVPGRLSILSAFHSKSFLYSGFVLARRALNREKRRFSAHVNQKKSAA